MTCLVIVRLLLTLARKKGLESSGSTALGLGGEFAIL